MNKEAFLKKYGITEAQFNGEEEISGDLRLHNILIRTL